jgi:hypothetical protein
MISMFKFYICVLFLKAITKYKKNVYKVILCVLFLKTKNIILINVNVNVNVKINVKVILNKRYNH